MKFTLTIELKNDAMLTYPDIALALNRISEHLKDGDMPERDDQAWIRDANGQTVGKWRVMRDRK